MTKYNSVKAEYNGITFHSRKECSRYKELLLLEKAGRISQLELQKPFLLIPKQADERAVKYIADFVYACNGKQIAEDVKGFRTPEYIIKRKLFKMKYPMYTFVET